MSNANLRKVGRKQKHWINSKTGLPVVGLSRMTDGRWRIIGTQIRFSEADEQKAIEKFYRLTADPNSFTIAEQQTERLQNEESRWLEHFKRMILDTPKRAAKKFGIEWLAYGTDLQPPPPLPSLDELEKNWETHAKCSTLQMKKVLRGWKDFRQTAKLVGLKDITPPVVVAFQDEVHKRGLSGKQQAHIFAGIRRLLSFNRKRAVAVDAITKALSYLEILEPSESAINLDPRPIEVAEWKELLKKAEGDDKAMILLMLNCALYLQEAIALEWTDFKDGCLVTRREKTGKCVRVAVLWQETLDAMAALKRRGEKLFYTYQGLPIKICGAQRRFSKITEAAKVNVTASQLRDGAYTAAVQGNVTTALCQLLVGHRSGIADHYVLRKPSMVAPACEAVYATYMK